MNSSCITCPIGTVYNITSLACEGNCTLNCLSCGSSTTCSICKSNYVLQSNGTCQSCPVGTYYNNSSCVSCPSGTYYNGSNLNCSSCPVNCD